MRSPLHRTPSILPLTLCCLLTSSVFAFDDLGPLNFRNTKRETREFAERVGVAIVKAARMAPRRAQLVNYSYTSPKVDRKELHISMSYSGAITRFRFTADMTVILNTTDNDRWEVLNIRYKDSNKNPVPYSEKRVQELIKQLNR